jgi:hypothetical protein
MLSGTVLPASAHKDTIKLTDFANSAQVEPPLMALNAQALQLLMLQLHAAATRSMLVDHAPAQLGSLIF